MEWNWRAEQEKEEEDLDGEKIGPLELKQLIFNQIHRHQRVSRGGIRLKVNQTFNLWGMDSSWTKEEGRRVSFLEQITKFPYKVNGTFYSSSSCLVSSVWWRKRGWIASKWQMPVIWWSSWSHPISIDKNTTIPLKTTFGSDK